MAPPVPLPKTLLLKGEIRGWGLVLAAVTMVGLVGMFGLAVCGWASVALLRGLVVGLMDGPTDLELELAIALSGG